MINRNEPRPAPIYKRPVPFAPHLTSRGACSDCHIPAIVAGNGDLKVCPRCHAVLWHRDYMGEQRRLKQEAYKAAIEAAAIRRAEKEAQKKLDRDLKASTEQKEPPEKEAAE